MEIENRIWFYRSKRNIYIFELASFLIVWGPVANGPQPEGGPQPGGWEPPPHSAWSPSTTVSSIIIDTVGHLFSPKKKYHLAECETKSCTSLLRGYKSRYGNTVKMLYMLIQLPSQMQRFGLQLTNKTLFFVSICLIWCSTSTVMIFLMPFLLELYV